MLHESRVMIGGEQRMEAWFSSSIDRYLPVRGHVTVKKQR
jgi:hypothetical protein